MSQMHVQKLDRALAELPQISADRNLHLFAEKGDLAAVKHAVSLGEAIDKRDTSRRTPLHCACSGASAEVWMRDASNLVVAVLIAPLSTQRALISRVEILQCMSSSALTMLHALSCC